VAVLALHPFSMSSTTKVEAFEPLPASPEQAAAAAGADAFPSASFPGAEGEEKKVGGGVVRSGGIAATATRISPKAAKREAERRRMFVDESEDAGAVGIYARTMRSFHALEERNTPAHDAALFPAPRTVVRRNRFVGRQRRSEVASMAADREEEKKTGHSSAGAGVSSLGASSTSKWRPRTGASTISGGRTRTGNVVARSFGEGGSLARFTGASDLQVPLSHGAAGAYQFRPKAAALTRNEMLRRGIS